MLWLQPTRCILTDAGTVLKDPSKWQARKPVAKIRGLPDGHDLLYASPTQARRTLSAPDSPTFTIDTADLVERKHTFDIDDPLVLEGRTLKELNTSREPVPVDPVALNEARLLCRQAMTLITEEVNPPTPHPSATPRSLTPTRPPASSPTPTSPTPISAA